MKRIALVLAVLLGLVTSAWTSELSIETIGALGGQNLYYSYMALGLVTDQFDKGVCTSDFAVGIAKDVLASCKRSRNYFVKLIDRGILAGEDAQLGKQMMDAYDSISSFANAFISVVETRNSETLKQLEKYKNSAWGKIQTILNLED